jgi:hypothetical protein
MSTTGEGYGDASMLGSDNEDSWYSSPKSHKAQRTAEQSMVHHAHYLAYPWDGLQLGTHLGSAALNEYLREQLREEVVHTGVVRRGQSVPQFTAHQCLPMVQSLRARTIVPPPKSELHSIIQKPLLGIANRATAISKASSNQADGEEYMEVAVDMVDEDDPEKTKMQHFYGPKIPFRSLAKLYETMCAQDVDDGREARRQAQFTTSEACIDRLRGMEDRISALKLREQRVLETARHVGLMPADGNAMSSGNEEINRLLGCVPRDDNGAED